MRESERPSGGPHRLPSARPTGSKLGYSPMLMRSDCPKKLLRFRKHFSEALVTTGNLFQPAAQMPEGQEPVAKGGCQARDGKA